MRINVRYRMLGPVEGLDRRGTGWGKSTRVRKTENVRPAQETTVISAEEAISDWKIRLCRNFPKMKVNCTTVIEVVVFTFI